MPAADALVEEVVHSLSAELSHEITTGVGRFVAREADDEMVFHGDRAFPENDSCGSTIRMTWPRGAAENDERGLVGERVAALFGDTRDFFPDRDITRVDVAA